VDKLKLAVKKKKQGINQVAIGRGDSTEFRNKKTLKRSRI
jgi:hypothetical protein